MTGARRYVTVFIATGMMSIFGCADVDRQLNACMGLDDGAEHDVLITHALSGSFAVVNRESVCRLSRVSIAPAANGNPFRSDSSQSDCMRQAYRATIQAQRENRDVIFVVSDIRALSDHADIHTITDAYVNTIGESPSICRG